jgi:hypothetical protein
MKIYLMTLVLIASGSLMAAELSEAHQDIQEKLESRLRVSSITDNTIRNEADEKIETLKFNTQQYTDRSDFEYRYQLRVTIELTDRRTKNSAFAQLITDVGRFNQDSDITGTIDWEFQLSHGPLGEKAKISAYAVEYGVLEDGVFIPVFGQYDDVESAKEIIDRNEVRIEDLRCVKKYIYVKD